MVKSQLEAVADFNGISKWVKLGVWNPPMICRERESPGSGRADVRQYSILINYKVVNSEEKAYWSTICTIKKN